MIGQRNRLGPTGSHWGTGPSQNDWVPWSPVLRTRDPVETPRESVTGSRDSGPSRRVARQWIAEVRTEVRG